MLLPSPTHFRFYCQAWPFYSWFIFFMLQTLMHNIKNRKAKKNIMLGLTQSLLEHELYLQSQNCKQCIQAFGLQCMLPWTKMWPRWDNKRRQHFLRRVRCRTTSWWTCRASFRTGDRQDHLRRSPLRAMPDSHRLSVDRAYLFKQKLFMIFQNKTLIIKVLTFA